MIIDDAFRHMTSPFKRSRHLGLSTANTPQSDTGLIFIFMNHRHPSANLSVKLRRHAQEPINRPHRSVTPPECSRNRRGAHSTRHVDPSEFSGHIPYDRQPIRDFPCFMYLMPTLNMMATMQVWDVVLDKWGSIPPVLWMYAYQPRARQGSQGRRRDPGIPMRLI